MWRATAPELPAKAGRRIRGNGRCFKLRSNSQQLPVPDFCFQHHDFNYWTELWLFRCRLLCQLLFSGAPDFQPPQILPSKVSPSAEKIPRLMAIPSSSTQVTSMGAVCNPISKLQQPRATVPDVDQIIDAIEHMDPGESEVCLPISLWHRANDTI